MKVLLAGRATGGANQPCRCAKTPQLQIYPFRQRGAVPRFPWRAYYSAPPTAWRACCPATRVAAVRRKRGVFPRHAGNADGCYPLPVSAGSPFGQYRHTRIRALPASPGVAIAEGWMDATLPLMEQVYEASTLDEALERERLTAALEEAANEFRRYSKRFAAGAQKRRRLFSISTHTCFPMRVCVVSYLPRSIKGRWQNGRLKRSLKNLLSSLRC